MDVLSQLSSRIWARTEGANRGVASMCLSNPDLLAEVASGLNGKDIPTVGDCAEVMTMVAEVRPEYIAPYAAMLAPLLGYRNTRVRWEATHAIALIAGQAADSVAPLLPRLAEIIGGDGSIIVRDYAVDAVGNYAKTSSLAARQAYPILREALTAWNGKHAHHALAGMASVGQCLPECSEELAALAQGYLGDDRAVVRKAARALLRTLPPGTGA